jgi:chemotaxis regulatin CheY-phosphate phosphatase CheZ
MSDHLPVISLEVSTGVFRIKTAEAVYEITVTADSSLSRAVDRAVQQEAAPAPSPAPSPAPEPKPLAMTPEEEAEALFYRDLTEDMYKEIGKLARQLSLSIREIPGEGFKGVDLEQTGLELEDAKGQLEDIVQMTEKATMDIMDMTETIQEDLLTVQQDLGAIKDLDFMTGAEDEGDLDWDADLPEAEAEPQAAPGGGLRDEVVGFLSEIAEQEQALRQSISELPALGQAPAAEAPAAAEPQVETRTVYKFDLDAVFQTLYELCTNETVKEHIKAMRGDQDSAFDGQTVLNGLSETAPTVDKDDDFFNFPISGVLKSLFNACKNEKYKAILKKMNQTAGSIFLDAILPLEGAVEETQVETPAAEPPPAPAAASPGLPEENIQALLEQVDGLLSRINEEKTRVLEMEEAEPAGPADQSDFTRVKTEDRQQIVKAVESANEIMQRTMNHVNRILEALSFQDLSGQRILKIVRLISDVQVQLLSLLVSFGSKIKYRKEVPPEAPTPAEDTDKLAQEQVDKMLERISKQPVDLAGPAAEGRLDQNEVDNLLGDLGF